MSLIRNSLTLTNDLHQNMEVSNLSGLLRDFKNRENLGILIKKYPVRKS